MPWDTAIRRWRLFEKCKRPRPRIGRRLRPIIALVARVRECVTGARVDFEIHGFRQRMHAHLKGSNFGRRYQAIKRAKVSQHPGMNTADAAQVCWQLAIIHHTSRKPRLTHRELQRQSAAHGPAQHADVCGVNVGTAYQIIKCRLQITERSILWQIAAEFARFRAVSRDFAGVEVHGQHQIAVRRQMCGLLSYPVVQPPPFMNHDNGPVATPVVWQQEHSGGTVRADLKHNPPCFR